MSLISESVSSFLPKVNQALKSIGIKVINPKFRLLSSSPRFLFTILGYFFLVTFFTISVLYYSITKYVEATHDYIKVSGAGFEMLSPLQTFQFELNLIFLMAGFAAVAAIAFVAIDLSNRITGPLAQVIDHMKNCREKEEYKHISLRYGSYLYELEDGYNKMVDKINSK